MTRVRRINAATLPLPGIVPTARASKVSGRRLGGGTCFEAGEERQRGEGGGRSEPPDHNSDPAESQQLFPLA